MERATYLRGHRHTRAMRASPLPQTPTSNSPLHSDGRVFVGTGPSPGALAMLFPGQGSQYVGMLRELACLFPGCKRRSRG